MKATAKLAPVALHRLIETVEGRSYPHHEMAGIMGTARQMWGLYLRGAKDPGTHGKTAAWTLAASQHLRRPVSLTYLSGDWTAEAM